MNQNQEFSQNKSVPDVVLFNNKLSDVEDSVKNLHSYIPKGKRLQDGVRLRGLDNYVKVSLKHHLQGLCIISLQQNYNFYYYKSILLSKCLKCIKL